jgi:septal ring factor EnvC (AmiA/AmiB activator)
MLSAAVDKERDVASKLDRVTADTKLLEADLRALEAEKQARNDRLARLQQEFSALTSRFSELEQTEQRSAAAKASFLQEFNRPRAKQPQIDAEVSAMMKRVTSARAGPAPSARAGARSLLADVGFDLQIASDDDEDDEAAPPTRDAPAPISKKTPAPAPALQSTKPSTKPAPPPSLLTRPLGPQQARPRLMVDQYKDPAIRRLAEALNKAYT